MTQTEIIIPPTCRMHFSSPKQAREYAKSKRDADHHALVFPCPTGLEVWHVLVLQDLGWSGE